MTWWNLRAVGGAAPLDQERAARHLTPAERARVPRTPAAFWAVFAAKEAAYKALSQAGIPTPVWRLYLPRDAPRRASRDPDLPRAAAVEDRLDDRGRGEGALRRALSRLLPQRARASLLSWAAVEKPEQADASDFGRERLAAMIARCSGDRISAARLTIAGEGGIPKVFAGGELLDCSVSLSHAGRFVACAVCM